MSMLQLIIFTLLTLSQAKEEAVFEPFWATISLSELECQDHKCWVKYEFNVRPKEIQSLEDKQVTMCETQKYEFPIKTILRCTLKNICIIKTKGFHKRLVKQSCLGIENVLPLFKQGD